MPLTNEADQTIGTLCVWDSQPRQWSSGHVQILNDLATMVRQRMFGSAE
jgi:GAF domain-containing protein